MIVTNVGKRRNRFSVPEVPPAGNTARRNTPYHQYQREYIPPSCGMYTPFGPLGFLQGNGFLAAVRPSCAFRNRPLKKTAPRGGFAESTTSGERE